MQDGRSGRVVHLRAFAEVLDETETTAVCTLESCDKLAVFRDSNGRQGDRRHGTADISIEVVAT